MTRWLWLLLLLLLSGLAQAQAPSFPDCASLGRAQPCATDLGKTLGDQAVNILTFGAKGDGITDDTAAIQATMDYASTHGIQTIFCPSGQYKISSTLYLDPPGNLRSNLSNPSNFAFSLAFVGTGQGWGNGFPYVGGCQLQTTFDNAPAIYVGPGLHMVIAHIGGVCEPCHYRGNIPSTSIGIALTGGNGGSSGILVEDVHFDFFYSGIKTDANNGCCLDDSVTIRKSSFTNGFAGVHIFGQQSAIITIEDCICGENTISIFNQANQDSVTVIGGNLSNEIAVSNSFGISSISTLTAVPNNGFPFTGNGSGNSWNLYTLTATIASPDRFWPNVYNSFVLKTAHFGLVPMVLCPAKYCGSNWNAGTNQATFMLWAPWHFASFGYSTDLTAGSTDIVAEIQAATTIYAAERTTVLYGGTMKATGITVEETNACFTLADTSQPLVGGSAPASSDGGNSIRIDNSTFGNTGNSGAALPVFYCQQAFPLFYQPSQGQIILDNNNFGEQADTLDAGIIDLTAQGVDGGSAPERAVFIATNNRRWQNPNVRYSSGLRNSITGFHPTNVTNGYLDQYSNGHGGGYWNPTPFFPRQPSSFPPFINQTLYARDGEMATPYIGWRPDPSRTPSMPPGLFSSVSGSLGALGTYPIINCETVYKVVDWNSGALAHLYARSASCPMFSYGQNLTNTSTGGTVTWSYKGQSNILALDSTTLTWMFAGLAITLGGSGTVGFSTDPLIVTGVYPTLGYVTVMDAAADGTTGVIPGTKTTVYSCSSSCSLVQAPYSWTQY